MQACTKYCKKKPRIMTELLLNKIEILTKDICYNHCRSLLYSPVLATDDCTASQETFQNTD